MKRIKSVIAVITLVIFVLGLSGCGLISKTAEGKKKTAIAKVNGEKITLGEFQDRLQLQKMQYEMYNANIFKTNPNLLESLKSNLYTQMLQEAVLMQKAEKDKLVVSDKDLDAAVQKQLADDIKSAGTEKEFLSILKAQDTTKEKYTENLRASLKVSKTISNVYDHYTKGVAVKDTDIMAEYQLNSYKYTVKPNTMTISHILVPTQEEAFKILAEIKKGMTFEAAAKKYGTDGTKDKGGLLGKNIAYDTTEYDADFMAGARKTKNNSVSEPVKTQFGYHLIKVTDKKENKVKPLSQVKASIKATLENKMKQDRFNTAFGTWYGTAKIEEFQDVINEDTTTK